MTIGFIDPPYLRHLGELASLKSTIACHFHEDSGLDYSSDDDRWAAILKESDASERTLLAAQIRELLTRNDAFVLEFWHDHSRYFCFESAQEVRLYLRPKLELLA